MLSKIIRCENVTQAFEQAYTMVDRYGEEVDSRIGKTKHLTDTFHPGIGSFKCSMNTKTP